MTAAEVLLRVLQQRALGGIHAFVVAWIVPEPEIKAQRPDHTEPGEEHEGHAPVHETQHPHHKQRREGTAPARRHPGDALRHAMLTLRQPHAEHLRDVREAARLPCPEEKPAHNHRRQIPRVTRRRREDAPEQNNAQQHPSRSPFIPQPAARDFKQRIGQSEGGKHIAHLRVIKAEVTLDVRPRLGDADPVDVMNDAQHHGKNDHAIARAGGGGQLVHGQ
jgi:hypothetical protein